MDIKELSMERAREWLSDKYDKATREAVADMIKNDPQEVVESFHKDLEFGTGGMRGIMGVGTNHEQIHDRSRQAWPTISKNSSPDAGYP